MAPPLVVRHAARLCGRSGRRRGGFARCVRETGIPGMPQASGGGGAELPQPRAAELRRMSISAEGAAAIISFFGFAGARRPPSF